MLCVVVARVARTGDNREAGESLRFRSGAAPATVKGRLAVKPDTCHDRLLNVHERGVSVGRIQRSTICQPVCAPKSPAATTGYLGSMSAHQSIRAADAAPSGVEPAYSIIKRNGSVMPFDANKIAVALTKAFLAVEGSEAGASRRVHEIVEKLTDEVVSALTRRASEGRVFHIEDVQDQVELALMRGGHQKVARAYVLYRADRAKARAETDSPVAASPAFTMADGSPLDEARLAAVIEEACADLEGVSASTIFTETRRNLYNGISAEELALAPILATRTSSAAKP